MIYATSLSVQLSSVQLSFLRLELVILILSHLPKSDMGFTTCEKSNEACFALYLFERACLTLDPEDQRILTFISKRRIFFTSVGEIFRGKVHERRCR